MEAKELCASQDFATYSVKLLAKIWTYADGLGSWAVDPRLGGHFGEANADEWEEKYGIRNAAAGKKHGFNESSNVPQWGGRMSH